MIAMRNSLLCLGVFLAAGADVNAQRAQRTQVRPQAGPARLGEPLVAKAIEEKLNLTADQKAKIAKIEKEFADKAKGNETTLKDQVQKARDDKDRAALKALQERITEARSVREGYEKQLQAVLTEEQRKAFQRPAAATGRPGAAAGTGFLPAPLQERLNLSAEQKEKLNQIQKDFEAKSLQVLTEEQRQQYDQLKKGRTRRPQQPRQRRTSLDADSVATSLLVPVTARSRRWVV